LGKQKSNRCYEESKDQDWGKVKPERTLIYQVNDNGHSPAHIFYIPAMEGKLLIYGATGYTGALIAREASKQGLTPIIAGRSAEKLARLAGELSVAYRVFDVKDIHNYLDGISLVLNCAGPFSATARPVVEACIEKSIHYLDIILPAN